MNVHPPLKFLVLLLCVWIVSPAAVGSAFYVATSGSDNNPGTLAAPFLTIQKAASVAQAGDTVYIRSGTYRETVRPTSSGSSGNPITFQSYQGETAVISGTAPVTSSWTHHSGSIYWTSATMPLGERSQVFLNGETAWEARWPNIPNYTLEGLRSGIATVKSVQSANQFGDSNLVGASGQWNGTSIYIRSGEISNGNGAWFAQSGKVTNYDATNKQLTVNVPIGGAGRVISVNNWYYLFGNLDLLDADREWHYDNAASRLYLRAPGGGIPSNVELRKREWAFNLDSRSHIVVRGLHLFASGITARDSSNILIDGINAEWLHYSSRAYSGSFSGDQETGIILQGDNNEVRNSTLRKSTHSTIDLNGNSNRVINNLIEDTSLAAATYGAAVGLTDSFFGLVSHNTFRGSGRMLIYNHGNGGGANLIQYNDFSRFMWLSSDGGAIYGYAREGRGEEVRYNRFSDAGIGGNERIAMYVDNHGRDVFIHHNLFFNIQGEAIRLNAPSSYNMVCNNTTWNVSKSVAYWGESPYANDWADNRVFNNIFSASYEAGSGHFSGNNLTSSTVPLLANPSSGDFTLQANSPAVDSGVEIPGITDGYLGAAPDRGSFERGAPVWTAGHDFANPPNPVFALSTTPWKNKLNTGGFSTLTPYTTFGSTIATSTASSTTTAASRRGFERVLKLTGTGGGGVSQVITGLLPSTSYQLTSWIYVEGGETARLSASDHGGATVTTDSTNTSFSRRTLAFTTGEANTTAKISFIKVTSNDGAVYFDDAGVAPTVLEAAPTTP